MKVIKRDGRIQVFDMDKIERTLQYASDEAGEPLTASDIKIVTEDILKRIKDKQDDQVTVQEIQEAVINTLASNGFSDVAKEYRFYIK